MGRARRPNKSYPPEKKSTYRRKQEQREREAIEEVGGVVVPIRKNLFKPKTDNQRRLISSIKSNACTFAMGPAGTGKSYVALSVACDMLVNGLIDKIICLKPNTEIDSELGVLPGNKDEKLAVLYNPMKQIFNKILGISHFENLIRNGKIILEPLGSILGMTYDRAIMVVDEAQYTTPGQMKVILTRLGEDTKIVICGDYKEQRFESGMSGLEDSYRRLRYKDSVGSIEFELSDIVRSPFTKQVIESYREKYDLAAE